MKKDYKNDEITVTWRPDVCIHSEKCFKGLPAVFNPNNRPWIQLDGASNQEIIDQVNNCPSQALSGRFNISQEVQEDGGLIEIEIADNGPILVKGGIQINYKGKSEVKTSKMTALCRCGASNNKPYCDGSHNKVGFSD